MRKKAVTRLLAPRLKLLRSLVVPLIY